MGDITPYNASLMIGLAFFVRLRLFRYLRYFQQEEYNPARFIDWIFENKAFDRRGTLVSLCLLFPLVLPGTAPIFAVVTGCFIACYALVEPDPRFYGKKALVMTARATSIYHVALSLVFLLILLSFMFNTLNNWATAFFIIQTPPLFLILAMLLLTPSEKKIQKHYKDEAHSKFMDIDPFTIGITGSFGKTSVKNLLGEVLNLSIGPTFWPQKGINTEMGITREIREKMRPDQQHAVIEMGAYHMGSITKLCNLTPINAAIVTAVHFVHLDRFGGLEEVYKAKSELAQAVPDDGILVVCGDNDGARRMAVEYPKKTTLMYGFNKSKGHLDAVMHSIKLDRDGSEFQIEFQGNNYSGKTKLFGESSLINLLGVFTMAVALGADPEVVLAVIKDIPPVNNRLEVVDHGAIVQINDAYNSNPEGFMSALNVLRGLPGSRRILITPGMIELGEKQAEENTRVAEYAATVCDEVILVNEVNKDALMQGLTNARFPKERIHYFATRNQAFLHLQTIQKDGDVVLVENDLPDLHEFTESF